MLEVNGVRFIGEQVHAGAPMCCVLGLYAEDLLVSWLCSFAAVLCREANASRCTWRCKRPGHNLDIACDEV